MLLSLVVVVGRIEPHFVDIAFALTVHRLEAETELLLGSAVRGDNINPQRLNPVRGIYYSCLRLLRRVDLCTRRRDATARSGLPPVLDLLDNAFESNALDTRADGSGHCAWDV